MNAYISRKYITVAVVNAAVASVCLYVTGYVYGALGWLASPVPYDIPTFLVLLVFGYMLGYVHERIPRCASRWDAALRFAGMMFLVALPMVFLFYGVQNIYDVLFLLDATMSVAGIPALVTVILMYRFAGDDVPKVCPA